MRSTKLVESKDLSPPLQEDIAGEQCLRRREIYLPQGVRQGRHQASNAVWRLATEEFYIQRCTLNSLLGLQLNSLPAKAVLPLQEGELHSRMFLKTPPLEEEVAQAKRCDGGVLHSAMHI